MKIKKLHPDAVVPTYATPGSACFDLSVVDCSQQTPVYKDARIAFRTGLAFEIPDGFVMLICGRSGHGFKNAVRLSNVLGIVDSDFRGEVMVKLTCDSHQVDVLRISPGDRIAQAMVIPVGKWAFEVVDELSSTERGVGGFGSTGS
jgi:dUTP pyrophosphatase